MSEPVKFITLNDGSKATHLMSWATDNNGNAIVYSQV